MDRIDRNILRLLQKDASLSIAEVAEQVGLSTTPCWRRIQNLEHAGVIRGRVALLHQEKLNVGTTVFVAVKTSQHNVDWFDRFAAAVADIDEVMEFHRMSGEVDYLLKIVVPDIAGYDRVYKRLIDMVDISDVSSSFSMERIKCTTELPLDYTD